MTIKEISTIYRKMKRAFDQFENALSSLRTCGNYETTPSFYDYTFHASQLLNACKMVEKLMNQTGMGFLPTTEWVSWWKSMTEERFTLAILQKQENNEEVNENA